MSQWKAKYNMTEISAGAVSSPSQSTRKNATDFRSKTGSAFVCTYGATLSFTKTFQLQISRFKYQSFIAANSGNYSSNKTKCEADKVLQQFQNLEDEISLQVMEGTWYIPYVVGGALVLLILFVIIAFVINKTCCSRRNYERI